MSTFGDAPACFLTLIHPGAWKGNSPKLNFRFTEFSEVRQLGIIATSPDFLMIQLDRACPTAPGRSGRGYGPLWMRVQRPVADMFSLSLQVVGKNVSSSKRACVGRVVLLTFCSTYLLLLGNAAFALLPLCVAQERQWCDHDYPRWGEHTLCNGQLKRPVLGPPASIMGRSSQSTWLRPFALLRPDALSPLPDRPTPCGRWCKRPQLNC